MDQSRVIDTSFAVQQRQWAHVRALSPAERLDRALALCALGHEIAWAGATRVAGSRGPDAIRYRYLEQTFGAGTASWVERRITVERRIAAESGA